MLKSDWWVIFAFYENILVWPLALAVLFLIVRAKTLRGRLYSAALLALVFLPHIHQWVGGVYFDYLCKTQAGEFIYRTVDNVEGILQMRPRDGSKDYFDRMRAGDIPEDPWGHTNWEAQRPATMFVNPPWAPYRFFETLRSQTDGLQPWNRVRAYVALDEPNARYSRYFGYDQNKKTPMVVEHVKDSKSTIGYTWVGSRRFDHWLLNTYPGEIRVVELASQEVLARKVGFYRIRPFASCPPGKDDKLVYDFVSRVAIPPTERPSK
jgi:hypothetical protein